MLDYPASITACRKCITRDPNNRKAKFFLSLAYLALEEFHTGCRYYSYRHDAKTLRQFTKLEIWSPELKTGSVLIWAEQGIDDEVMFIQFLTRAVQLPNNLKIQ